MRNQAAPSLCREQVAILDRGFPLFIGALIAVVVLVCTASAILMLASGVSL